ncbi:MAG: 50S ribosomal protein L31e [Candidatus Thermoplasmatota archaeon]|nr:50S ribosomal protein L31e [Candidatus Thermoplasmatota archaeon]MBU4256092.1 50S ribosomal protein L31e [Candidatus Thermoplasmatota archaeon]
MVEEEERIYTIPLRTSAPKTKKASNAIKTIRKYIIRHMKPDKVWMDTDLNERIWTRGIQKPPASVRVKAVKFEDGLVEVSLPGLEEKEKTEEKEEKKKESKVKKSGKTKEKEKSKKKQQKTEVSEEKKKEEERVKKTEKTKENEKKASNIEKDK